MKADSWRPAVAACADPPRVREVGALGFLKIVGTCALVLTMFALAIVLLAARRSSDLPSATAGAEAPPIAGVHPASGERQPPNSAAADALLPRVAEVAEIECAEPLEVAAAPGRCNTANAEPGVAAVCGQARPQNVALKPEQAIAATNNAEIPKPSAGPSQPLKAAAVPAAPASKPRKRPPGNLALAADAAENLPATPPNKLVKDRHLGTQLTWAASPEAAALEAQREGKLLFLLHLSGNFELPEFT